MSSDNIIYLYSQCLSKHCNRECMHFNASAEMNCGDYVCYFCLCSRSKHRRFAMIFNGKLHRIDDGGNLIEQVGLAATRDFDTPLQSTNVGPLKGYQNNSNPLMFQTTDAEKRSLFAFKTKTDVTPSHSKAKPKVTQLKVTNDNSTTGLTLIIMERLDPLPQCNTNYNCLLESKQLEYNFSLFSQKAFEQNLFDSPLGERFLETECYYLYTRKNKKLIPTGYSD